MHCITYFLACRDKIFAKNQPKEGFILAHGARRKVKQLVARPLSVGEQTDERQQHCPHQDAGFSAHLKLQRNSRVHQQGSSKSCQVDNQN